MTTASKDEVEALAQKIASAVYAVVVGQPGPLAAAAVTIVAAAFVRGAAIPGKEVDALVTGAVAFLDMAKVAQLGRPPHGMARPPYPEH